MAPALIDKQYLLEKYPGKGGWTYAAIPEIPQDKKAPFGWVKVTGSIDGYELKNYKLMPMGNGQLFLPVKAEIRKKIGKQAGDYVHVVLFTDESLFDIPEELELCLINFPQAHAAFSSYTEGEQKSFVDWIYAAKTEQTKIRRINETIDAVIQGKKFKYRQ